MLHSILSQHYLLKNIGKYFSLLKIFQRKISSFNVRYFPFTEF